MINYHKRYYNRTNACDRCSISFDKVSGHPLREYNKEGNWTGKWLCQNCYQKYSSSSQGSLKKSLAGRRTGNLNTNSESAKGDLFQKLTCEWRCVKDLNIENDNYESPIDHSSDSELGIIQTKGATLRLMCKYRERYYCYYVWNTRWDTEYSKDFNNLIFYCASDNMKNIERIYIFPKEEIMKRKSIIIYKNPTREVWYEQYRIKDEKILEFVNKIWQKIINKDSIIKYRKR